MTVQLGKLQERLRSSLFFVPMLFVLGAVALAEVMLALDGRVDDIPSRLTATVDSGRNVLAVVAGATLTFAGIAFSVSLLLISLASSQYSPRVVHGLFRDPFNKRVIGVVIGTFTYCLVVLRAIRGPIGDSGEAVVPSAAILLAAVLGVVSVLSIVAFISHGAHTMDVSKILHNVTEEALSQVRATWPARDPGTADEDVQPPDGEGFVVTFDKQGWVQQIDHDALMAALEPEACVQLATVAGRYAIPETTLCTVWPVPNDEDEVRRSVRASVAVGETRTTQQDVTYGVRQLADVALKGLSPGINDPTTAQDALFHLGAVVRELLVRRPPPRRRTGTGDRVVLLPEAITHGDLIGLAFDEVRIAAVTQPTVQVYLLEILHLLEVSLRGSEHEQTRAALRRQAALVVESGELADVPDEDRKRVRTAHERRFGASTG